MAGGKELTGNLEGEGRAKSIAEKMVRTVGIGLAHGADDVGGFFLDGAVALGGFHRSASGSGFKSPLAFELRSKSAVAFGAAVGVMNEIKRGAVLRFAEYGERLPGDFRRGGWCRCARAAARVRAPEC